jgi:hypothetical protein
LLVALYADWRKTLENWRYSAGGGAGSKMVRRQIGYLARCVICNLAGYATAFAPLIIGDVLFLTFYKMVSDDYLNDDYGF